MRITNRSVLVALAVAASLGAQSGPDIDGSHRPPPPLQLDTVTGGGTAAAAKTDFDRLAASVPQQEPDYSLRGLFQQAHGDFMLKRERYHPMLEVSGSWFPNYEIRSESGKFDLLRGNVDLELPLTVSPDAYILVGGYAEDRRYQVQNMTNFSDDSVYAVGAKLGFAWFVDPNTLLEVTTMPGVWSDLKTTLDRHDYDYPSRALLTIRSADDFFFKVGARYNQVFRDAPWLPYLGFSWMITEQFRFDVLAPESVELSWWASPSFGVQLGAEIQGGQYHVHQPGTGGRVSNDIQVQEIIAYLGGTWRFNDYFSFGGRAGVTLAGDYKLGDQPKPARMATGTLGPGFFAEATMGFNF